MTTPYERLRDAAIRPTPDALRRLTLAELVDLCERTPEPEATYARALLLCSPDPWDHCQEPDGTYTLLYGDQAIARLVEGYDRALRTFAEWFEAVYPPTLAEARERIAECRCYTASDLSTAIDAVALIVGAAWRQRVQWATPATLRGGEHAPIRDMAAVIHPDRITLCAARADGGLGAPIAIVKVQP